MVSRESLDRRELFDKLCYWGQQLSGATIMFHQAVADQLGLNPTDHKCAGLVLTKGPMSAGELAEATCLTTGAITGVIDRLEKAGFVQRADDPNDRRRVIVCAVPKRIREIARLFDDLTAEMAELSSHYTDAELAVILDFMSRSCNGLYAATRKLRRREKSAGKARQRRLQKKTGANRP